MIALDTSGILALLDRGERDHANAHQALNQHKGTRYTTDFVLAEVDYLILKRLGVQAERAFIAQILSGAIKRQPLQDEDIETAAALIDKYRDQELGLTDATLASLALRTRTKEILTLDQRHFSMFRDYQGQPFRLLP